jgi:putative transposase
MGRLTRRSPEEKREIIHIVEQSKLSITRTLKELELSRSTFYRWCQVFQQEGESGLVYQKPRPQQFWNKIPDPVRQQVVDLALAYPDRSSRQLA